MLYTAAPHKSKARNALEGLAQEREALLDPYAQKLIAIYGSCNSLHTNAFDEAIVEELTELVEEAALAEFEKIAERGTDAQSSSAGSVEGACDDEPLVP